MKANRKRSEFPLPLPHGRGSETIVELCSTVQAEARTHKSRRKRRGATMLEFTLLGIPALFLCLSIVATSIDMWQFFILNYAVAETARYASMHGATCSANGNTCTIKQSDVATYFENAAFALAPAGTTLKLTDSSGTTTCVPTSCSSSTQFPASGHNAVGSNITIQGSYTLINPIFMYWPGSGSVAANNFNVSSSSTQAILF